MLLWATSYRLDSTGLSETGPQPLSVTVSVMCVKVQRVEAEQ